MIVKLIIKQKTFTTEHLKKREFRRTFMRLEKFRRRKIERELTSRDDPLEIVELLAVDMEYIAHFSKT